MEEESCAQTEAVRAQLTQALERETAHVEKLQSQLEESEKERLQLLDRGRTPGNPTVEEAQAECRKYKQQLAKMERAMKKVPISIKWS